MVDSKGQLYLTNKHRQINVGKALANWNYQRQRPTLESLPNEVLLKIQSLLSVKDLINIQGISQTFFHFCTDFDDDLWLPIVKENLGHLYNRMVDIVTPFSSWKAVYFLLNATNDYVTEIENTNDCLTQQFISRNQTLRNDHYIFIMSQLRLTSHPRSTVVLLDTETPGTSREIYETNSWYQ